MPELLLANGLAGVALGLAVLGILLRSDVARLGELVAGSEQGPVAFLLAAVGFGSTSAAWWRAPRPSCRRTERRVLADRSFRAK